MKYIGNPIIKKIDSLNCDWNYPDAIFNRKDNLHTYIISGGKENKLERVISYKINKADNKLYMAVLQFVIISLTLNYKNL